MSKLNKINDLIEKINLNVQIDKEIKEGLIALSSSFSDNYYFYIINSTEYNTLGFCFYLPNNEDNEKDSNQKSFIEVEIRNSFEDQLLTHSDFNGFEVKINQFTAPLDIISSMMYGEEIKNGIIPVNSNEFINLDYLKDKPIIKREKNDISFIDFISKTNKEQILPYLENLNGIMHEQNKEEQKEFIIEYNELFDKLIHSLYSKKSLINNIKNSEIKEVTDIMTNNNYIKMNENLTPKINNLKLTKL